MINWFRKIKRSKSPIKAAIEQGALVIDVRTKAEYNEVHIANAINIPLKELEAQLPLIKQQQKIIITCCRSGARSNIACQQMKAAGVICYDGGAWQQLQKQID